MNRPTILFGTALLATLVVLATLAGGVTAAVGPAATAPQVAANETTTTENATAPGAQLAGVVGVQQAEVDGDLDNRTFGLRVANADSDAERAAIIAERQNSTRAQLASQTDRLADLREARANGTISNAEYRARVATVAAQAADTERDADQLNRTARKLPDAVRERANINVSAIEQLRTNARTLGGPETAAIARSIGGTTARNPMAGDTRGPPMGTPGKEQAAPSGSGPVGERGGQADRGPARQGPANTSEQAQTPEETGRDRNATPAETDDRRGGGNNENAGRDDDSDDTDGSRSSDNADNSGNSNNAGGAANRP
ncbi:hypothetical protein DM826_03860 [Halonotius aquaticus]|uniref:Uncharacterized protein n=1 Tax=Halonotius aquaticus TaxID=2216978 RepID=A0A3A6QBC6_9EURY|nr:hypothetical protein [Halonotius aquaticus]RJX44219.1 hypothetical protein DM826_03860 [Halonotius aquaticus]